MSKFEFPELEGWVSVARLATQLNVSRQTVHKMLGGGTFKQEEVRQVGSEVKPFYLISCEARDRVLAERGAHTL